MARSHAMQKSTMGPRGTLMQRAEVRWRGSLSQTPDGWGQAEFTGSNTTRLAHVLAGFATRIQWRGSPKSSLGKQGDC